MANFNKGREIDLIKYVPDVLADVDEYKAIMTLETQRKKEQWEVVAVAMTVLASYPGEETVELLKQGLYSRNWYVRSNAAESLSRLRADYQQLRDVLEGPDPYARQILRFQLEHAMTDEERRNAD